MRKIAIILWLLTCPAWGQGTNQFKNFIGGLPAATSAATGDKLYILQGGQNKSISPTAVGSGGGGANQGTDATTAGVDCTGVADSTAAIQAFVNANPSGRLLFPLNCTFYTTSTILEHNTENFQFAGVPNTFGPPSVVWKWKGSNGGAACALDPTACVFVIDIENSGYPVITDIQMQSNNSGGDNCPDGFIRADQALGGNVTTQGLFQNLWLDNSHCNNPGIISTNSSNFMGISISPVSVNNVEDFSLNNVLIVCGQTYRNKYVKDAVTNSTTTVTSATANFQNAWAGKIVSVSYAGGRFDTTIASVTNSTTIVLAHAVPWTQNNVTLIVDQPIGIGIYVGKSANSIQHLLNQINYDLCSAGIYLAGGNAQIIQPKSGFSTYGMYIGTLAQNLSVDQYAAEGDFEAFHSFNNGLPTTFTNGRLTNTTPFASGFMAANGTGFSFISNFFDFGGAVMPANAVQMNPGYRMAPTALGAITGGSGYVDGVYTNVVLTNPYLVDTAVADITVSGGAVTSVTLDADPGNFNAFRVGSLLTTANTHLGGAGSGFSVAVAAMNFQVGNPSNIVTTGNDFTGGTGPTSLAQTGLTAWVTVPSSSRWTSFGDVFGSQTVANAQLGGTIFGCGKDPGPAACAYILHDAFPAAQAGKDLYGMEVFTTWPGAGDVQAGTTGYLATGDAANTGVANGDWTGFKVIPLSGAWANPSTFVDFQASNDLATGITLPGGSLYSFKANTPANVIHFGSDMANAYGLYVAAQKTTNVTNGWGIVQAGASDGNTFAGPTTMASLSVTTGATCAAGTVSTATLTILNGIVTHC